MWEWIYQLESEKFDLTEKMRRQKYEVGNLAENTLEMRETTLKMSVEFMTSNFQHMFECLFTYLFISRSTCS